MPDTHNTKNFMAHGGGELVIGGKLTLLYGADVTGLDAILPKIENQADSTATTITLLKDDFNTLLAALKAAGYMEADEPESPEGENTEGGDDNGGGEGGNGEGGEGGSEDQIR